MSQSLSWTRMTSLIFLSTKGPVTGFKKSFQNGVVTITTFRILSFPVSIQGICFGVGFIKGKKNVVFNGVINTPFSTPYNIVITYIQGSPLKDRTRSESDLVSDQKTLRLFVKTFLLVFGSVIQYGPC